MGINTEKIKTPCCLLRYDSMKHAKTKKNARDEKSGVLNDTLHSRKNCTNKNNMPPNKPVFKNSDKY